MSSENHARLRQIRGGTGCVQECFGRVDTVLSSGKKRIDQFPTIVKENSTQIRQYQEIVSGLIGIFKEHDFLHELNLQVPEATVAKLPARLFGSCRVCRRKTKVVNLGYICQLAGKRGKNQRVQAAVDAV